MQKVLDQDTASRKVLHDSQKVRFPYTIKTSGLKITDREKVFSPKHFHGWEVFNRLMPSVRGKSVLEIGTATGVTALYLATKGAKKVVAVDINTHAVKNAKENVKLNKLSQIEIRHSDIFSALKPDERFDVIYWNMPYSRVSKTYKHRSTLERSLFDPDYSILNRFLRNGKKFLTTRGRILIGTGTSADMEKFAQISKKYRYRARLIGKEDSTEINPVVFELYELKPL